MLNTECRHWLRRRVRVKCVTSNTNIHRAATCLNSEFCILHFFDENPVLTFDPPDTHLLRANGTADDAVDVPLGAGDAAEHVEAETGVLGKRVTRQVRFGQDLQSGQTAGVRKAMPHCRCDRSESCGVEDGEEQRVERGRIAQCRRVAPGGFDDPFDPDRGQSW
jgi:hypothetical protein